MAAPAKRVQLRTAMNSTKAIMFLPFSLRPNVHNEGRPACGASLSIVGLDGCTFLLGELKNASPRIAPSTSVATNSKNVSGGPEIDAPKKNEPTAVSPKNIKSRYL